ncbi:MAG: AraC-like DNA-binding protein [Flavobacteriales bacterium]|jgi:AraC-like DNA-binding protein
MHLILFNTHDVVLLITTYICSLFAILLIATSKEKRTSNFLLAGFLFAHAAIPTGILLQFGEGLHDIRLDIPANLFLLFDLAYWVEAPLLLLYTRSLIFKGYKIRRSELLLFLPFALYTCHQAMGYLMPQQIPPGGGGTPAYINIVIFGREVFRVALSLICIIQLRHYRNRIQDHYSATENLDLQWLRILCYGFLGVRVWAVGVNSFFIYFDDFKLSISSENLGLIGNYATFGLISILTFYSLKLSPLIKGVEQTRPPAINADIKHDDIERLSALMKNEKPHLTHSLTLNQLAKMVGLGPRPLSTLINRHFEKTFFEFVNFYRIEEAKQLLKAEDSRKTTVLEVMLESGFSSKAAFNRFFKKYTGCTPSEFKKNKNT